MTYCVGILLNEGMVFASDSRTNAGVDNFAKFCKMTVFERKGDRVIVLLSSGSLAGTQAIVSVLKQRGEASDGTPNLWNARTMFDVAGIVSDATREVERRDARHLERAEVAFNASFIFGGQIKGEPPRLFRTYAETNFIEAEGDTPYLADGRDEVRQTHPRPGDYARHQLVGRDQVRARLVRFDDAQQSLGRHADRFPALRARQLGRQPPPSLRSG